MSSDLGKTHLIVGILVHWQQQLHFVAQSAGAHQLCPLLLGTYMLYGCILDLGLDLFSLWHSKRSIWWVDETGNATNELLYSLLYIFKKKWFVCFLALFLDNLCYLTIHRRWRLKPDRRISYRLSAWYCRVKYWIRLLVSAAFIWILVERIKNSKQVKLLLF